MKGAAARRLHRLAPPSYFPEREGNVLQAQQPGEPW